MFNIGDHVEVYRRQERPGFHKAESGTKGIVVGKYNHSFHGEWYIIHPYNDINWISVKKPYLKRST